MIKTIKYLVAFLFLAVMINGCTTNGYLVTTKMGEKTVVKEANISQDIKLKLINEYNEVYDLKDVIIGYNGHRYDPLEPKFIEENIISSNDKFNSLYKSFAKEDSGSYLTFTDEAMLAILANEYSMKLVVFDEKNNSFSDIDFKSSDISLSRELRHDIYFGFIDTFTYYESRDKDE